MILIFLGSWRSTLIIAVSIPLSILSSIIVLSALGETINIMTLGGLALAVGILVDDATVAIENINRTSSRARSSSRRSSTAPIRSPCPAFVSTLCICIVFVPMFFLSGVGPLPVRADGRGGGVRDARVLRPVADAGADDGEVPAEGARAARPRRAAAQPVRRRVQRAIDARLPAAARRLPRPARSACVGRRGCSRRVFLLACVASFALLPVGRPGLLSRGRQRPVQAAPARPDRHPDRGDGGALRPRSNA